MKSIKFQKGNSTAAFSHFGRNDEKLRYAGIMEMNWPNLVYGAEVLSELGCSAKRIARRAPSNNHDQAKGPGCFKYLSTIASEVRIVMAMRLSVGRAVGACGITELPRIKRFDA